MRYEFQIHITDADYTDFNIFHLTRSPYAAPLRKGTYLPLVLIWVLAIVLQFLREGLTATTVVCALLMAAIGGLLFWKFDSIYAFLTRRLMRNMKKSGKMPFAPVSQVIFDGDVILEITPEQRTERTWSGVERLCMVDGEVWYLYLNNSSGFILPVDQLRAQADIDEFLRYVTEKCPRIDRIN